MSGLQQCYSTTTRWTACAAGATPPAQVCLPPRRLNMSRQILHTASPLSHSRLSNHRGGLPIRQPLSTVAVKAVVPRVEQVGSGAYDAKTNNRYWERRPVPMVSRLIVIGAELTRWYAQSMLLKLKLNPQQYGKAGAPPDFAPTPASLMREMLCRLGPAFVKIGQALSSRPDLLPPAYLMEFEQLQDRIPPFPNDQAFQVLEAELGVSVSTLFSSFSPEPVAAASLGQVYRAKLRGSPGQPDMDVAVKVQRPGVAQSISLDVYILRWAAAVLRQVRKLNTDLPALVDEWASSLFRELDYRTELDNAERFKALYSHMKEIYVPCMFKDFTTSQVLTMEWIDGVRLRSASSAERMEAVMRRAQGGSGSSSSSSSSPGLRGSEEDLALVEAGVRCSLEQMLEDGFYHADPHPGNLLKMRDGRLAYLDFGMCGSLDKKTRQALVTSTLHLVNREYTRLADDFVNLGLLPSGADKSKVVPALTEVFQSALSAGVTNVSFSQLSGNLGRTMYQFNFRIPPYYTLLVRSLTVLEGIALASNPDYKVLGSAYPWIARRLLTDKSPELREALRALLYGQDGRFRFSRLESLLQEAVLTPPSSKPKPGSTSSGTSSGTNSSNGAANGGVLALLLGDEGEFVRDILLDELAKGIDGGWRLAFDASVDAAARAPALLFSPSWLFPNPMPNPSLISTTSSASSRGSSSSGGGGGSNQGWGGRPLPSSAGSAAGGSNSSSSALVTTSSDAQQSSSAQQGGAQGSSSSNGGSSGGAQPPSTAPTSSVPAQEHTGAMTYQGGLLMSALPRLSSQEDYEQVQGILQLSRAMAALVAIRREATSTQDRPSSSVRGSGSDSSTRGGRDIGGPGAQQDLRSEGFILPQPLTAVEQGSTALTWLATELLAVPPEMRAQALRLPGELASRVTSRILARTLRSLAGANGSSSSSSNSASTGV